MNARILTIAILLLTISSASAAIIALDGTCAGEYDGRSIRTIIDNTANRSSHNCIDIRCALATDGGLPISVSDGTVAAANGERLLGAQSYLLTSASDLRAIAGVCRTPAFIEAYCSARWDWNMHVGITRHYVPYDSTATYEGTVDWPDDRKLILGEPASQITGLEREARTLGPIDAYTCTDELGPQLLHDDRFDLRTGERTLHLIFSDNEWEYRREYGSYPISLLMDVSPDGTASVDEVDKTTLDSCAYAITNPGAAPSTWTSVACTDLYEADVMVELGDRMSGTLHMRATDSAGNDADLTYDFDVFYPALGEDEYGDPQGYCPRPNECFIDADGNESVNTFNEYLVGGQVPACVTPGQGAGDVYCSSNGRIDRSQSVLAYGISQLGTSAGSVYCGDPEELTGMAAGHTPCANLPVPAQQTCSVTCVMSLDSEPTQWQQSAALFAANNFLTHESASRMLFAPVAFTDRLEYSGSGDQRYFNLSRIGCVMSGSNADCTTRLTRGNPDELGMDASIVYENETGIAGVSQTMTLAHATPARIETGHDALEPLLTTLTSQLNDYLRDIASDPNEAPQYAPSALKELTRISAYRTDGTRTILGVSTNVDAFSYRVGVGQSAGSGQLTVVAVTYTGFSSNQIGIIGQAKDAITSVHTEPVRMITIPPLAGEGAGGTYTILVAAKGEAEAHELIERLVVRLRP